MKYPNHLKEFINKNLLTKRGSVSTGKLYRSKSFIEDNTEILAELLSVTDTNTYAEAIYLIINDLDKPKCKVCGTFTEFKNFNKGYRKFCSSECRKKYLATNEFKNQVSSTLTKKYGGRGFASDSIRKKAEATNIEKYGTKNAGQSSKIKEKIASTFKEKYGAHPWKTKEIKKKIKETNFSKYGVDSFSKQHLKNTDKIGPEYKEFVLSNFVSDGLLDVDKFCEFYGYTAPYQIKKYLANFNISSDEVKLSKLNLFEQSVEKFIKELEVTYFTNDRTVIAPYELDFILPDRKIAIECNGDYWHSDSLINPDYHKMKSDLATNKGYLLLHIFESEWYSKTEIWKSVIKAKLGLLENKIYARKCSIKSINNTDYKNFIEQTHLQGYAPAKYKYGLFYNDSLVAVMSFGKSRFKKDEYELIRFSTILNTHIPGAFQKLLKHFLKTNSEKISKITSYANRRWSSGEVYKRSGFTFIHETAPNYFYVKNNQTYSRQKFQKHKLKHLYESGMLSFYDETLSERDNMYKNHYKRIYDAGNLKFTLFINN